MGNGVTSTDSIRAQKRQERYDAKVAKEKEKIAKKAEEIKAKAEKEKAAAELARTIAGDSNHIESSTVKQYVKDELKAQYKNGEITKEEYKAAKDFATSHDYKKELKQNENDFASRVVARFAKDSDGLNARAVRSDVKADLKDHFDKDSEIYQVAEKYATKGSVVGRFFDKKSDSRVMFEAKSQRNNVEKVKAEGPDFSARQQARLEAAGYNTSDVYALADEAGGKYDGTIQYSYKDGENEIKKSVELFNNNENGVEFSRHQVKKLMRDAGYKVENKVSVGELAKDMLKGAVAGAPFSYINAGQSQATTVNGIADIVNNQNVEIIGVGPAIGAALGAVGSTVAQIKRTKDDRYEDLGKLVTDEPMKTIKLPDIELKTELPKVELQDTVIKTKTPDVAVVDVDRECYTVEQGDTWYTVAKAKYNATDAEAVKIARYLKEQQFNHLKELGQLPEGVTKSTDAFFVKVGDELCLPKDLTLGDKTYTYHKENEVEKLALGDDYKGSIEYSNPFKTTVDNTTYGYRGSLKSESGLSEADRDKAIREYVQEAKENGINVKVEDKEIEVK